MLTAFTHAGGNLLTSVPTEFAALTNLELFHIFGNYIECSAAEKIVPVKVNFECSDIRSLHI